jgi:hypothetical protein
MSKYEPLTQFLQNQPGNIARLSFAQIEQIVGFKLPAAALQERAWWSNAPSDDAESQAWLAAGFRSEYIDLVAGELTFCRGEPVKSDEQAAEEPRSIFGFMKGTVTIAPGVDLTEPADPDLAEWLDRKYGPAP